MRSLPVVLVVLVGAQSACKSSSRATQDPKDALGAVVYLSSKEPALALETGPLILTDVMIDGHAGKIFTANDIGCKERDPGSLFDWNVPEYEPEETQSHHAMKLFVPAGKTLCLQTFAGITKLVWAGSRADQ